MHHSAHFLLVAHTADGRPVRAGTHTPWEVRVSGPGRVLVGLVDHQDGTATVRYTCDCSGRHRIAVRLGKEHLAGSPFEVDVGVPMHANSLLRRITAMTCTLRGLFTRWVMHLPPGPSHPKTRDGREHAVSNAWALDSMARGLEMWRRAAPHLANARLARGLAALREWRVGSGALATVCDRIHTLRTARRLSIGWRRLRQQCSTKQEKGQAVRAVTAAARQLATRLRFERSVGRWAAKCKARRAAAAQHTQSMRHASVTACRWRAGRGLRSWKDATRAALRVARAASRLEVLADRHAFRRHGQLLVAAMEHWHSRLEAARTLTRDLILLRFRLGHRRKWRLSSAMRTWLSHRQKDEAAAHELERADAPARHRKLTRALRCWQAVRAAEQLQHEHVAVGFGRWRDTQRRAALDVWRRARAAASTFVHASGVLERGRCAAALVAWVTRADVIAREDRVLEYAHARLSRKELAAAIARWASLQKDETKVRRAVARRRLRARLAPFEWWRAFASARRLALRRLGAAASTFVGRHLMPAWNTWCAYHALRAQERRWLADCLPWVVQARLSGRRCARAVARWKAVAHATKAFRACSMRLAGRRYRRQLRHAMRDWKEFAPTQTMDAALRRRQRYGGVTVESAEQKELKELKAAKELRDRQLDRQRRADAHAASDLEHSRHLLRVSHMQQQRARETGGARRVPLARPAPPEQDGRFGHGFTPTRIDLRSDVVRLTVPKGHCRTFMAFGGTLP